MGYIYIIIYIHYSNDNSNEMSNYQNEVNVQKNYTRVSNPNSIECLKDQGRQVFFSRLEIKLRFGHRSVAVWRSQHFAAQRLIMLIQRTRHEKCRISVYFNAVHLFQQSFEILVM